MIRKPPPGKLSGAERLRRILDPSYPNDGSWFKEFETCIEIFVEDLAATTPGDSTYNGKTTLAYLDLFRDELWAVRKQIGAVNWPGAGRTELLSAFGAVDRALARLRAALTYPADESTVAAVRAAAQALADQDDHIHEAFGKLGR